MDGKTAVKIAEKFLEEYRGKIINYRSSECSKSSLMANEFFGTLCGKNEMKFERYILDLTDADLTPMWITHPDLFSDLCSYHGKIYDEVHGIAEKNKYPGTDNYTTGMDFESIARNELSLIRRARNETGTMYMSQTYISCLLTYDDVVIDKERFFIWRMSN